MGDLVSFRGVRSARRAVAAADSTLPLVLVRQTNESLVEQMIALLNMNLQPQELRQTAIVRAETYLSSGLAVDPVELARAPRDPAIPGDLELRALSTLDRWLVAQDNAPEPAQLDTALAPILPGMRAQLRPTVGAGPQPDPGNGWIIAW